MATRTVPTTQPASTTVPSRLVPFAKMHGTHNDFIVVDARVTTILDWKAFARFACDRRRAIGADGVLVIDDSTVADAGMRIFNADGSEAEMCGNGIRCVARFLAENGEGDARRIHTIAGIIGTRVIARDPEYLISVDMPPPKIERRAVPIQNAVFVNLGNPHIVIFASSLDDVDLAAAAHRLATIRSFSDGVNLHVAVRESEHKLAVRHYERGVGETASCGTGAIACAGAAIMLEMATSPIDVHVPGGTLRVEWDGGTSVAYLTGPATRVFDAVIAYDSFA